MDELVSRLPASLSWLRAPSALAALFVLSVALFAASIVAVPWFLARMPADYFSRRDEEHLGSDGARWPAWRIAARVLKNLLGLSLFLVGVAMLVLPGQGILTIFVSVLLLDFPGKRRLERRIVGVPAVRRAINALRHRAGKPPVVLE